MRHALCLATACAALLPAAAHAAPPPGDARSAPQDLGPLPALVRSTTVEATIDADEPSSMCGPVKNSVWFSFTASTSRELLVALDAAGDMDAVVDVFRRERSQLFPVACQATDRRGGATIDVDTEAGTTHLVRVAALANSIADRFALRVVQPDRPAQPPGELLGSGPRGGQVDRFANPDDAWSARMRKGRTYRINLVTVGQGCAQLAMYAPGEFGGEAQETMGCDSHAVFTAPAAGRYTFHVRAPRASRAVLRYRLAVGAAGTDDTAPGVVLADDRRTRGSLRGSRLDALDLYRFSIARRSDLRLRLRTSEQFDLRLLTDGGRTLACACRFAGDKELTRRLSPGRYFVALRSRDGANGNYVLARLARVITHADMRVDRAAVAPGESVALTLRVRPAVSGRASILIERYDPLAGWLFHSVRKPRVSGNQATVPFRPPSVGRWRATGEYLGTRKTSPSRGGTVRLRVLEPLADDSPAAAG
jgi:hypothetical protein